MGTVASLERGVSTLDAFAAAGARSPSPLPRSPSPLLRRNPGSEKKQYSSYQLKKSQAGVQYSFCVACKRELRGRGTDCGVISPAAASVRWPEERRTSAAELAPSLRLRLDSSLLALSLAIERSEGVMDLLETSLAYGWTHPVLAALYVAPSLIPPTCVRCESDFRRHLR